MSNSVQGSSAVVLYHRIVVAEKTLEATCTTVVVVTKPTVAAEATVADHNSAQQDGKYKEALPLWLCDK